MAAIARREGVLPNYVRRLTRLAFLAPKIVEAIATGLQPRELNAKTLTERIELPLLWTEQERALGINQTELIPCVRKSSPSSALIAHQAAPTNSRQRGQ